MILKKIQYNFYDPYCEYGNAILLYSYAVDLKIQNNHQKDYDGAIGYSKDKYGEVFCFDYDHFSSQHGEFKNNLLEYSIHEYTEELCCVFNDQFLFI